MSALHKKIGESISAQISAGFTTGLAWGENIFRNYSDNCVHCRSATSGGVRRGKLGVFVRLCAACWRGAGGEAR